jgi:hypothetical protein
LVSILSIASTTQSAQSRSASPSPLRQRPTWASILLGSTTAPLTRSPDRIGWEVWRYDRLWRDGGITLVVCALGREDRNRRPGVSTDSLCPRCDLPEELLHRNDLRTAHVLERRASVSVERGQGGHVKVDEEEVSDTAVRLGVSGGTRTRRAPDTGSTPAPSHVGVGS